MDKNECLIDPGKQLATRSKIVVRNYKCNLCICSTPPPTPHYFHLTLKIVKHQTLFTSNVPWKCRENWVFNFSVLKKEWLWLNSHFVGSVVIRKAKQNLNYSLTAEWGELRAEFKKLPGRSNLCECCLSLPMRSKPAWREIAQNSMPVFRCPCSIQKKHNVNVIKFSVESHLCFCIVLFLPFLAEVSLFGLQPVSLITFSSQNHP